MESALKIDLIGQDNAGLVEKLLDSMGALFEQTAAFKLLGDSSQLRAAAGAAKRSLMSFDKLNRLVAKSSKGKATTSMEAFFEAMKDDQAAKELGGSMGAVARTFRALGLEVKDGQYWLRRLQEGMEAMPFTVQRLLKPAVELCRQLGDFPTATERMRAALGKLDVCNIHTSTLMEGLLKSTQSAAGGIRQSFSGMADFFEKQVAVPLEAVLASLFSDMKPGAQQAWDGTKQVFSDAAGYFSATFRNAWDGVLAVFSKTDTTFGGVVGSVVSSMKSVMNRLISGINEAIVEPFTGINSAFSKLKSFTVNGVQPFKNLNFSVSMPKIPLLASGAVLPANKPFLAMVGDQKHGTNVEAPLATIQQAVAEVMEDVLQADIAGHNATVSVLRQILEAVLGIRLDENTLGRAVARYSSNQAVITGGF